MKIVLFLFFSLLRQQVLANALVSEIKSPTEFHVEIQDASGFWVQRKIIIVSKDTNKASGFGTVMSVNETLFPMTAAIQVDELINNNLIVPGDIAYPLNYQLLKDKKVQGFASLTLSGDKSMPSQYKELSYFGVFTSEGHTLDAQEVLISPFQIQYGIYDNFGVKIVNALWLDGYVNGGLKYRVLKNKYAKISLNGFGAYKVQDQDWISQLGGVVTLPANAKFQNHLMFTVTLDKQFDDANATKGLGLFQDSDIRSITEYVTDDWNRILYGVAYNVELQAFGGTFSYMWIWDTFHMSLGLATKNFSNLRVNREAYYYVYDLFWRF